MYPKVLLGYNVVRAKTPGDGCIVFLAENANKMLFNRRFPAHAYGPLAPAVKQRSGFSFQLLWPLHLIVSWATRKKVYMARLGVLWLEELGKYKYFSGYLGARPQ